MLASDEEDFPVRHHALEERLAGRELGLEFGRWIEVGIDFPPQSLPRRRERLHDFGEEGLPHDHKVEIAPGALIAARDRAVHEGGGDPPGERLERRAQHVGDPGGLLQHVAQIVEDRAGRIRLELDLVADRLADEDPGVGEQIQLAQQRARGLARQARDLAHVQRKLRMQQEQREHVAAVSAEEKRGEVAGHGGRVLLLRQRS